MWLTATNGAEPLRANLRAYSVDAGATEARDDLFTLVASFIEVSYLTIYAAPRSWYAP